MVRRRISEAQRWHIIGMHTTGMSVKAIGRQMGYHYAVFSRLVRRHTQTNNVKDLSRSGRPRVTTSDRDDRGLQHLVRRMPFATSPVLKQHWLPNRRLSTRIVRNRLKSAGLKSRRVIKRPLLADRHRRTRLAWCLARRGWNLRTWRKIH
jgi:IS30 family transposase